MHVGNRQVVVCALSQGYQSHALGQLQIGQMNDAAELNLGHVDLDELGQILRQTGNFHFSHGVGNDTALLLDANAGFLVHEVQGNLDSHLVTGDYTQKVNVHDARLGRVALHGLEQDVFLLAIDNINGSMLDQLVVTNTIPLSAAGENCERIRQLDMAPIIAEAMRRISNEESISAMFR